MPVTPTGICTLPLYRMALLIAASSTFQSATSTASASAALAKIHWPEADDNTTSPPRCIIAPGPDFDYTRIGHGQYELRGSALVFFEFEDGSSSATLNDNYRTFLNQLGGIIAECSVLAGVSDDGSGVTYLNAVSWSSVMMPERCESQHENGSFYFVGGYLVRYE